MRPNDWYHVFLFLLTAYPPGYTLRPGSQHTFSVVFLWSSREPFGFFVSYLTSLSLMIPQIDLSECNGILNEYKS